MNQKEVDRGYFTTLAFDIILFITLSAMIIGACHAPKPLTYDCPEVTVTFTPVDSIDSLDYEQAIWAQENHKL